MRTCVVLGLCLFVTACASGPTQYYERLQPLSNAEKSSFTCQDIDADRTKTQAYLAEVRKTRQETNIKHVVGALVDLGISNYLEAEHAEQSGIDRLNDLKALEAEKGCTDTHA